jgi:hypothetical protein
MIETPNAAMSGSLPKLACAARVHGGGTLPRVNPNGVVKQSPGLAPRQPWVWATRCPSTPTGLRPVDRETGCLRPPLATTPLGLRALPSPPPRVVPSVQPWALLHNRVAVETAPYSCPPLLRLAPLASGTCFPRQARVRWFTFAAAVVTGLFCGLVPGWRVSGTDLHGRLEQGGQRAAADLFFENRPKRNCLCHVECLGMSGTMIATPNSTRLSFHRDAGYNRLGSAGLRPGPGGTSDNSPTLQRWVWFPVRIRPEGTAERAWGFSRPFGTRPRWKPQPNAEALGYSHASLRDRIGVACHFFRGNLTSPN